MNATRSHGSIPSKQCSVQGCSRKYRCKGYCNRHYRRVLQYGEPTPPHLEKTAEQRFWEKVNVGDPSECWPWQAAMRGDYGFFNLENTTIGAHKFSYILSHGEVPSGLVVDHKCRNPRCVNPSHLQAVTLSENAQNVAKPWASNNSGYRNVWWCKTWNRWTGQVTVMGKKHSIGYHRDIGDADKAARALRSDLFKNNLAEEGVVDA